MKNKGFTLIELIVVMAILGLLATVSLGSFRSSQMKGRDAQRKHDLGQIQRALEAYYNDKGRYPGALPGGGGEWRDTEVEGGTLYMKKVPKDPRFGNYYYISDGTYYKLYARLENGKDPEIPKDADNNPIPYSGTSCGGQECNYGVSSPNVNP